MTKELYFVDTNILVYVRDRTHPEKCSRAREWLEKLWREKTGRVSTQVLNEYYVTVTRKLSPGLSQQKARADIQDLSVWKPTPIAYKLIESAWKLEEQFSLSWWDSLIVAAAIQEQTTYLLTEDLQDGLEIESIKILNPFR